MSLCADINHKSMFLDLPPKAKEIKEKINKCDLINLKATHSKGNH